MQMSSAGGVIYLEYNNCTSINMACLHMFQMVIEDFCSMLTKDLLVVGVQELLVLLVPER
jgi:hypothetical protein